jgi:hypothetical protein
MTTLAALMRNVGSHSFFLRELFGGTSIEDALSKVYKIFLRLQSHVSHGPARTASDAGNLNLYELRGS